VTSNELLRWLRRRLQLSQPDLAVRLGIDIATVAGWEQLCHGIPPWNHDWLGQLLTPHLATPVGEASA
jgi:hypothetical protein